MLTPSCLYKKVLIIGCNDVDNFICVRILDLSLIAESFTLKKSTNLAKIYIEKAIINNETLPELIILDEECSEEESFKFYNWFNDLPLHVGYQSRLLVLSLTCRNAKQISKYKFIKAYLKKPLTISAINQVNWK